MVTYQVTDISTRSEGFIVSKPTHYGLRVSLNPRKSHEIITFMKRFFPEVYFECARVLLAITLCLSLPLYRSFKGPWLDTKKSG